MIPTKASDDDASRVGHITSLHVLPHLRGRGYGRMLIDHVFAEFQPRRFAEVTLWGLEKNWSALRFYQNHGFHLECVTRRYPRTKLPHMSNPITPTIPYSRPG